jgi:hypothetical protein
LVSASLVAVLLIGYQVWWLKILVFATDAFGRRLQRGAGHFLRRRKMTEASTRLRPTQEEEQQLGLRTLEATRVFRTVARGAGLLVAVVVGFSIGWGAALAVLVAQICWGQMLASLGYAGWLPTPDPE